MGLRYTPVQWNKHKKSYDLVLASGVLLLAFSFVVLHLILNPQITIETLIIRTSALVAIVLLHFILIIGPLCRMNPVFLPLLYNRRHLGVTMFLFAAVHGIFSMIQFHSLGDTNAIASIFLSNTKYAEISNFPFQVLGFFALIILFLMAATSHDFWLKNLSPKVWKTLHMMVYVAYGLLILHVALGILQYENKPVYWIILLLGFLTVAVFHVSAGLKEFRNLKQQTLDLKEKNYFRACRVDDISEGCGTSVWVESQNIAIFKYEGKLSAVNNVCRHQMGPLAEGRVVDGCITCPWHGYQYRPADGQSPPPFKEKLETYSIKVLENWIWVNPNPFAEGTFVEPAEIKSTKS